MKLSRRLILLLIVFLALTGILAFGSSMIPSRSEASSINNQVQNIQPTTLVIFLNNVQIALAGFIPLVGPIFEGYTVYSTGFAFSAIAQTQSGGQISGLETFLVTMLTPIFWMEFFSYSVAVEESISLLISFKNHDFRNEEWKWIIGSVVAVVVVLFASARLEATLVNTFK